jgi:Spy/CpxP family protein refolding chaperone
MMQGQGMMQGDMMQNMPMMMQRMRAMHQRMMQNPMHRARMMAFMLPAMADTLGLSEEQTAQLNQLKSEAMAQRKEQMKQVKAHRRQLMALFDEDGQPSADAMRAHLTAMAELQTDQKIALYGTAQEMRQVLTAEQRKTLSSMSMKQRMRQMMANMPMMDMMQMMQSMHGGMMGGGMMQMMQDMPMQKGGMMQEGGMMQQGDSKNGTGQ